MQIGTGIAVGEERANRVRSYTLMSLSRTPHNNDGSMTLTARALTLIARNPAPSAIFGMRMNDEDE